jgi:flagellar basal body-associated protein FliL
MEDWIGILAVILMVPGLILLLAVVTIAAVHLKRREKAAAAEIAVPPVSNTRDVDA